jgi:hypothetical protein
LPLPLPSPSLPSLLLRIVRTVESVRSRT